MFLEPFWDDECFVTRLVILLEVSIWKSDCGDELMHLVTNNGNGVVSEWCSGGIKGSNLCQCVSKESHNKKQPVLFLARHSEFTPVSLPAILTLSFNKKKLTFSMLMIKSFPLILYQQTTFDMFIYGLAGAFLLYLQISCFSCASMGLFSVFPKLLVGECE